MNRTLIYRIADKDAALKVEQYLRRRGYSRQNLIRLKKIQDGVMLNGSCCHMNWRLSAGDELTIHIRETESSEKIVPVPLPVDLVYEDEDILVVNKPAGMPTHPSMNNYMNSLANALAWYYKEQGKPFIFRCGNRLDRDTSGLTVIAKHMLSSGILSSMAVRREVHREYLAVVRGRVEPPEGTIDAPLSRKPGSIIEREVDFENGEAAVTHYRLLKEKNGHSLISLRLETGRTHQIRIHMKYLGFPLIGDYLYNPDMEHIGRQALHSARLAFRHPITGEEMDFSAPLPEDMRMVLDGPSDAGQL
ncbi:RluA family pseudouridine synthase [Lacrimispora sp. NSJ-141]|uniref:Pseudouridine synthase n=1 Tax=Lientehia hominis TaxID=2897778 RepID=A0AAP2W9P3_9FIRM|nr:RluA family pseudouridine synthase [Lientehia hominis]MCD2491979.1 RluA family pseudouridine synthase [Lientehia hominis]